MRALVALLLLLAVARAEIYTGPCLEHCCCKVCSAPSNEAFPYGLTTVPMDENPEHPTIAGSTCYFPVWSDREYNDTDGNPVSPPDTLWWTSFAVFGNLEEYAAPSICSCCQFSQVDTSCYEERPAATRPTTMTVSSADVVEFTSVTVTLSNGYELSTSDIVEIRNDTHCGYTDPVYVQRSDAADLVVNESTRELSWTVPSLPAAGCYRICYYHVNLTTPTWYFIDNLRVFADPAASVTYTLNSHDVPLSGNAVAITFKGLNLLSVFDDVAEFRTSGSCGDGGETISTATTGSLDVLQGAVWCKPPLEPKLTTYRPLQFIDPAYSDCPTDNRLAQDQLVWSLSLPAAATYTLCFRTKGTWQDAGTFTVEPQATALTALQSLYTATNGDHWYHKKGWDGADACAFHGVRCENGDVTAIYLGRNNLDGIIPSSLFLAEYFSTLESISMEENTLTGTVPFTIGAIRNLKYLNLGFNRISGTLPSSLQRTSLIQFYVPNNDLDGTVPDTVEELNLLWYKYNSLEAEDNTTESPLCPTDEMVCSEVGSTDDGVTMCGYDGIKEEECVVRDCCFNAQAPLVFGGSTCFTKRTATFFTHPPCSGTSSCVKQDPPEE